MRRIETPMPERVESGPVVFDHCGPTGKGYDWPGVFLRGDVCLATLPKLKKLLATTESGFASQLDTTLIRDLIRYMEEATTNHGHPASWL